MGLFNKFPYTDLNNINLDVTLTNINNLIAEGNQLYTALRAWQNQTQEENLLFKNQLLADINTWETNLNASLEAWKDSVDQSVIDQITAAKAELLAYADTVLAGAVAAKEAAEAAQAAAEDAEDGAEAAQEAAEEASANAEQTAENISNSLNQITTNTNDITNLKSATSLSNGNPISYSIAGTGHCIKYADGTVSSEDLADFGYTDYVDISQYAFIAYKRTKHTILAPIVGMAFYDASKNYVTGVQAAKSQQSTGYETNLYKVGVPGTAKYARFSLYVNTSTYGTFEINGDPNIYTRLNNNTIDIKALNDYGYLKIATFATWDNKGIAETGQLQNDTTKGRSILTLPVYSDMTVGVSCDSDVEYRLFYYQLGTDANASHFVKSSDYTQYPTILERGYSYKILGRYKATPSTAISDINAFGAKIHSFIYREKGYIEDNFPSAKNLFNKNDSDILEDGYLDKNGNFVSNELYFETGYIECIDLDEFYCAHWTIGETKSLIVNFYDSAKNRVSETHSYTVPLVIPGYLNIRYFRIAMNAQYRNSLVIYKNINGYLSKLIPYNNFDILLNNGKQSLYDTISNQWLDKNWYAYGTSLTSVSQGTYAPYVADFSKLILTNKGIPGGGICADTRVKSAVMNITDGKLDADLITLEVGANEASATLGTIYDTGDSTFCGALNQCIQYLQENTSAQIVVMSSTAAVYAPNDPTTPYPPSYVYPGGWTKHQMNTAIREICECNGVYYIPMGDGIGYGYARVKDDTTYRSDQIHHSELGGYNIAKGIWSYLKNIPLWYSTLPS